jgi:hypothetical protein
MRRVPPVFANVARKRCELPAETRTTTPPSLLAALVGARPPSDVAAAHRSPRAHRSTGSGKPGRRRSWSARCLLTPRISAISTTRRSFRRVTVRSIREDAEAGGEPLPPATRASPLTLWPSVNPPMSRTLVPRASGNVPRDYRPSARLRFGRWTSLLSYPARPATISPPSSPRASLPRWLWRHLCGTSRSTGSRDPESKRISYSVLPGGADSSARKGRRHPTPKPSQVRDSPNNW